MAEWSNAAVLKTVVRQRTGGSNPSFSAEKGVNRIRRFTPFFISQGWGWESAKNLDFVRT